MLQWLGHTSVLDFQCPRRNSSLDLFSLFPLIRLNVDRLSHVASSDRLVSSDGPKAQLVTLGHSPHNCPSKLRFSSPSEEKSGVLTF